MWIHRLSNVDLDNKKATCSECGQVALHISNAGRLCANGRKISRQKEYAKAKAKRALSPKKDKRFSDVISSSTKSAYIKEQKNKPCMDCGISFPYYVMDFDHRDPSQKNANLARMLGCSFSEIIAEIAKCDVVCSNCHRERTYGKKTTPPTK